MGLAPGDDPVRMHTKALFADINIATRCGYHVFLFL
jgi:hypothetical protein